MVSHQTSSHIQSLLQDHLYASKDDAHLSGFESGIGCYTSESRIECQTTRPVFECHTSKSGFECQTPESGIERQASGIEFECQTTESGFELLSDEQTTSLLLSMDAETLLECGR